MQRLAACLTLISWVGAQEAPRHVLFTWQGDTGTTLTVNFQTFTEVEHLTQVYWDTVSRDGVVDDYRHRLDCATGTIPGLAGRFAHRAELTDLAPGGVVHLVVGDPQRGISREYRVRTIPHDGRPLRFVTGGDMGTESRTRQLLRQAARTDPDFVLIGGDVAYANGRLENVDRWDTWLTYWCEEMVRSDGCSIPLVLAIGNHEVDGSYGQAQDHAPFFFGLFAQGGRSYFARRFGARMVAFALDSGHVAAHGGEQAAWLDAALTDHADAPFKVACYHVPLYPSHRAFEGTGSVAGREHWGPLFDRHRLTVAFENHDHTYKRSIRLRGGAPAADGVLYLGDGCFGRAPRAVAYGGRWYLDRQGSIAHFWCVDVDADGAVYRAIDERGQVFDVHPPEAAGAALAAREFAAHRPRYALPGHAVRIAPWVQDPQDARGGTVAVTVTNAFDVPALAFARLYEGPAGVVVRGVDGLEVAPGKSRSFAVEIGLAESRVLEDGDVELLIGLVLQGADGEEIEISEDFDVPVRSR